MAVRPYGLYRDAARTQFWGRVLGTNTVGGTGTAAQQSIPVCCASTCSAPARSSAPRPGWSTTAPGIHLHGRVPHDDIPRWLARSHCSVLSSLGWDNQPMTVAESVTALRGVIWCDPALTEGVDRAGLETLAEGRCVQTLHVGTFDDEAGVLDAMHHEFIPAPVLDASAAAVEARRLFGRDRFARSVLDVYRLAAGNPRLRPTLITESPA